MVKNADQTTDRNVSTDEPIKDNDVRIDPLPFTADLGPCSPYGMAIRRAHRWSANLLLLHYILRGMDEGQPRLVTE